MSRRSPARQPVLAGHDVLALPTRDLVIAALLAAALCGVVTGAEAAVVDGVWAWARPVASRIHWGLVPVIAALTTLHFLGSAISVRAVTDGVAGRRLCVWEITSAQFAGSAANRLAPGGLGSAAVNCRYLTRRGLLGCEATAAVATVGIARGATKLALLALAAWYAPGAWRLPLPGVARHPYVPVAAIIAGAVAALALAAAWRHGRRIGAAAAGVVASLRRIVRQPRSLVVSLAAATAAHCALALAFVVSVLAVPDAGPYALGTLPAVYLVGATAGAAIPTPAGVGTTEAALIAALAAAHMPAAAAAQGVLLFRVMTFWAPVPVGVLSSRWLRARGGL
jgi:uncharacterized membrane protein YbhN (UPF0104 family)